MRKSSNVIFDVPSYISIPSDAVNKLSPMAFATLGYIESSIYNNPNSKITINDLVSATNTNKYDVGAYLKELIANHYINYNNGNFQINVEI